MKVSQLKENIRNIVRKKLSEATIDVTNPATETPQTKKAKIDIARRTTGNKNLGTEKDPVEFIEETDDTPKKYTVADINKMSKAELADFIGLNLTPSELRNYTYSNLYGAARELADDEIIDESDTGDQPISSMSRADLLKHFNLPPNTSEDEYSDEYLRDALSELDEADYIDDDDAIHEDVEDVDSSGDEMAKYYDEIYEGDFKANVAPGSMYQLNVEPHPTRPNLIILSQDNGQRVVVNVEDVNSLINILRELA